MGDNSLIEWTDATWNPVTGCTVVSPGCTNCYAMRLAGTRLKNHPTRVGLTKPSKAGPVWTGEVRMNEKALLEPLKWKRPRMIFVCAHGDLFHESVPDAWIDKVFAVMALCPQHTFQVLTKRSARMLEFFTGHRRAPPDYEKRVPGHTPVMRLQGFIADFVRLGRFQPNGFGPVYAEDKAKARDRMRSYPLPNVWLGVSAERQQEAEARIPDLLATPAAVRFVSLEPLLGPIDLDAVKFTAAPGFFGSALRWHHRGKCHLDDGISYPILDWVIVGGESQQGSRPMHPDWARSLRDRCAAAGVPFFFKQWGDWAPRADGIHHGLTAMQGSLNQQTITASTDRSRVGMTVYHAGRGHDRSIEILERVSKKRAGRLLDGVEHNGMPAVDSRAEATTQRAPEPAEA